MKVKTLSLTNYRGFERLEIEFHPQVNVIAGINGVGKSSVLHALRVLLSRGLPELTGMNIPPTDFLDSDIREGQDHALAACRVESEGLDFDMDAQLRESDAVQAMQREFYRLDEEISGLGTYDRLELAREQWNEIQGRIKDAKERQKELERRIREEKIFWRFRSKDGNEAAPRWRKTTTKKKTNPLVVYFSASRQIPAVKRMSSVTPKLNVKNAYNNALEDRPVSLVEITQWLRSESYLGRSETMEKLKSSMSSFIDIDNFDFSDDEQKNLRFWKGETPLSVQQLSDGERASLAIISDLSRRLSQANPGMRDPVRQGKGVVLIDEIELHLHPAWQRKVMENLTRTFPGCQFIVTSHSPQIIGEVENNSVRFLTRNRSSRISAWTPDQTLGLDSNLILEIMGASHINEEIEADLQEADRLVEAEKFSDAKEKIAKIKQKVNGSTPDIVRLETMISFLETSNDKN